MKPFVLVLVFVIAGIPVLAGLGITLVEAGDLAAWKALLQPVVPAFDHETPEPAADKICSRRQLAIIANWHAT